MRRSGESKTQQAGHAFGFPLNQENIHAPPPHAFAFFLRLRPIDKSVTDR